MYFKLAHNKQSVLFEGVADSLKKMCWEWDACRQHSIDLLSLFQLGPISNFSHNIHVWSFRAQCNSPGQDASCVSGLKCVLRATAGW